MNEERIRHDRSAKGIKKALDALVKNRPEVENLVTAFGPLLIAKAEFKEKNPLSTEVTLDSKRFDPETFRKGEPLFASMGLMDFHDALPRAAKTILPAMSTALKGIRDSLEKIEKGFSTHGFDTKACIRAVLEDHQETFDKEAEKVGASVDIFKFVLDQLTKPFMEMQAALFAPLTQGHQWLHGYCPVCGSYAAISGLIGDGGKRWLQCATCSHEWRFNRHTCPRCGDKEHDNHEYFFDENGPAKAGERVDLCKACHTYLLTKDVRQLIDPVKMEVVALGMVPLDILAQEKGYSPLATTPWNTL